MKTKEQPFNFGPIRGANGNAKAMDSYGDMMEFWITVEDRIIIAASFVSDGCDDAIRCGSAAASLVTGKAPCAAYTITQEQILQEASLPNECGHYALLALTTIIKAVDNFKSIHDSTCPSNSKCDSSYDVSSACGHSSQYGTSSSASATRSSSCHAKNVDDHSKEVAPNNKLPNIKHKIAVLSGKGGVGKSTVATNLAFVLSTSGYKVGLLDADIHGPSIPTMLNLTDTSIDADSEGIIPVTVGNLKVVSIGFFLRNSAEALIWRGPVKIGVINQFLHEVKWGHLDFLIIDLPPGTGDEPLSIGQAFTSQDGAVIVTTPQEVASSDVRKSITFCQTMKIPILGIIENMSGFVCPNCEMVTQIFGAHGGRDLAKAFGLTLLGEIPIDPTIVLTGDHGTPYVTTHAHSKAAIVFKGIINSILEAINKRR